MARPSVLFVGKVIGYWTLIQKVNKKWLCECKCGTKKEVASTSLTAEVSTSCGCLRKELLRGIGNPMHNPITAKKVGAGVRAAMTATSKMQHALSMNTPAAKEKRKATNNIRYGGNSPASSLDIQKKMTETNMTRFGYTSAAQSPIIKQQVEDYCMDTYGVTNIMKLDSYKKIVSDAVSKSRRDSGIETLPNGLIVVDECRVQGVLPTTYRNWRRELGADIAQQKLYGDRLIFRSQLEVKLVALLQPLTLKGATVEIWNKKAHPDLRYRPDVRISIGGRELFIDIDGLYWHSSDPEVDTDSYHLDKAADFLKLGVSLLQFREDELYNKESIIYSMVEHKIGFTSTKYGARNLILGTVSQQDASIFLYDNHLMGNINGVKSVGLYDDNQQLIALLCYKIIKDEKMIDISRFCVKKNTSVSGAFSRLLNYIEKSTPDINKIQNFVDYRYSIGNSSIQSDFILDNIHLGWRWTDGKNTYDRRKCMADKELGLSEVENAKRLKWYKLFDAGQAKLIKTLRKDPSNA